MSHAPEASTALGVALFWLSLALYLALLRARAGRVAREVGRGPT
ncbi:MAG: hypothetical protein QXO51_02155 [Halobacteria archaeon]